MRVFILKKFAKWSKKAGITLTNLIKSAKEIEEGLIDAILDDILIKKRISVGSKGKRGGARVILAYKQNDRIFFLFGFEKNE